MVLSASHNYDFTWLNKSTHVQYIARRLKDTFKLCLSIDKYYFAEKQMHVGGKVGI